MQYTYIAKNDKRLSFPSGSFRYFIFDGLVLSLVFVIIIFFKLNVTNPSIGLPISESGYVN